MQPAYSIQHCPVIRMLLIMPAIILLQAAQAQPAGPGEAATIIKQLRSGMADTQRVQMLLRLSTLYFNRTLNPDHDLDSALLLVNQALHLSQQTRFTKGQEDAIFLKGRIYIKQQNSAEVWQLLANAAGALRIKLLVEQGKSMLRTPYLQKGNRDSAIIFFQEAGQESDNIGNRQLKEESLCLLGIVYLLNDNWEKGKTCLKQVIEARKQAGDKAGALNACLRMAAATFCDNCTENIIVLKEALELSQQIGDRALEAIIRLEMGYKYLNDGNAVQAEEEAETALAIQKKIGYPAISRACKGFAEQSIYDAPTDYGYLSNAYYLLSDISQDKGNLNQKLFYILKVVDDVENSNMTGELDYTYFRLGNAYWELGQFDKSIAYHKQSIAISHQKGELVQVGMARRMTVALIKQKKVGDALALLYEIIDRRLLCNTEDKMYIAQSLGSCYNALGQYAGAEKYYLESVAWSRQSSLRFQYVAYQGISRFYVENAHYSKAEPYLEQLLKATPQQILPNYLAGVHLMWFKVDSARQNYPGAIHHYQQYKVLQDSIFNATKSKQIAQLSIQYETAKKEQDIKIKEKNIALLKEQNKVQQNQRNAFIVGTGLLAAILVLGFNRYNLKQRVNRQLRYQQQVLHAQQEQIKQKNEHLSELVAEKDLLLLQKDTLIGEKDQLLTEKEWLVKEIHHRVKNNFHIVASLLEIQSSYLKNKEALSAIKDSQNRIHSMSIIHQKLYQSETLSTIHMPEYIYELVEYLRESYSIRENIGFSLQIENVELNHASAITLGLILNEAITNAIKYAFTKTKDKQISISLSRISATQLMLGIADNGRGLPGDFNTGVGASMGMELLQGLAGDLGGNFSIETNNGTQIKVIFDYKSQTV